jgi:hypothetical protein
LSDESPGLPELGRWIQRLDADIRADIREVKTTFISRDLFLSMHGALTDRVLRLEQADTTKTTGNRTWLLGLVQTVIGVALGAVAAVLMAKGGR